MVNTLQKFAASELQSVHHYGGFSSGKSLKCEIDSRAVWTQVQNQLVN